MADPKLTFFATAAKGIEASVEAELAALSRRFPEALIDDIKAIRAGASFTGTLQAGYLACLWLRTASRVLLRLSEAPASSPEQLYSSVRRINWADHMEADQTLAVDFGASQSRITHTHFGALKTKDAIVDQFMDEYDERPSVDTKYPDVRVNVYVLRDRATISLDLSGSALHERGYREEMGPAPLKENLAAALLLTAKFPELFEAGGTLVDPMCGSGTLPIEAVRMVCDVAPGLDRKHFGFMNWRKHDPVMWQKIRRHAEKAAADGIDRARGDKRSQFPFVGFDEDPRAVHTASQTMERLGLQGLVHFEKRELDLAAPRASATSGLVICNPPYGERMGDEALLKETYRRIGDLYKQKFKGWKGFVFTGSLPLSKEVGLRADRKHIFFNGAIECRLLEYNLY
ncbi:MAG: hypothetical protein HY042_09330 [Spirochaetia bacterium]|nr:hypothetical protein [Spirochaetia bacterium]